MAEIKTVQFTGGTVHANPALAPAISDWEKEPDVRTLKEDLEAAKQGHDNHVLNVGRWRDLMTTKGKAAAKKVPGRSSVQPKLIRRQAEWRYSALTEPFLGSDKIFDVEPVTFEDEDAARQNELVLNWQLRTKINRVRFIDEFVRTNVDEGSAVVRVGWKRQTIKVKEEVAEFTFIMPESEQDVTMLEQAILLQRENPREYADLPEELRAAVDFFEETQQPNIAIRVGTSTVEVERVIDNRPTLELIAPENIYIDPSCGGDLDKAMFVIVSFETSKAELLKAGDRYKNLDYVNWENASVLASTDHSSQTPQTFNFKDTLRKRIVAYEYWGYYDIDGNDTLTPIVATWVGDTMIRMERNPFPDEKPPFVVTNYMPVKRELMGEPDAELLEDNQNILGALTRGMIDLMGRSANSQQGMAKGMLDPINRRRYDNGQDYEFNPNMHPAQNVINHTYPEIPTSAYNMLQLQNQEAEALTGVKSFSGGMSGEAYGDVAAGIRGVLDASSKREMAILRRLAKGMTQIGEKMIAMNGEFLSEEEVVRVTNDEFVKVKREDLAGNFDLTVDISTAEVDNQKAQDLGFMLQTIGPNMDFSMTQMILTEIADLKRMPALAERIRKFKPTPDPLLEKAKELEVMKLQKEIEFIQSNIDKNKADTVKKYAEADQTNLDVVEQETGTKHERDMEKQKGQAEGNQNLEITKALVKSRKNTMGGETPGSIEAAIGWNEMSKRLPNGRQRMPNDIGNIGSFINRNMEAEIDPRLSVNSKYFEPQNDPALNPAIRI
jgi:hypothetical protein